MLFSLPKDPTFPLALISFTLKKHFPSAFLIVQICWLWNLNGSFSQNVFILNCFLPSYAIEPFSIYHKPSGKVCFTKSLVTGAWGKARGECLHGAKSTAQRGPHCSGRRVSRDREPTAAAETESRRDRDRANHPPRLWSSPRSMPRRISLSCRHERKSHRETEHFGHSGYTREKWDSLGQVLLRTLPVFGASIRTLGNLIFHWGMWRGSRKIPPTPPLLCRVSWLQATTWESGSPAGSAPRSSKRVKAEGACWGAPWGFSRSWKMLPLPSNDAREGPLPTNCSAHQSQTCLGGWYGSFFLAYPWKDSYGSTGPARSKRGTLLECNFNVKE